MNALRGFRDVVRGFGRPKPEVQAEAGTPEPLNDQGDVTAATAEVAVGARERMQEAFAMGGATSKEVKVWAHDVPTELPKIGAKRRNQIAFWQAVRRALNIVAGRKEGRNQIFVRYNGQRVQVDGCAGDDNRPLLRIKGADGTLRTVPIFGSEVVYLRDDDTSSTSVPVPVEAEDVTIEVEADGAKDDKVGKPDRRRGRTIREWPSFIKKSIPAGTSVESRRRFCAELRNSRDHVVEIDGALFQVVWVASDDGSLKVRDRKGVEKNFPLNDVAVTYIGHELPAGQSLAELPQEPVAAPNQHGKGFEAALELGQRYQAIAALQAAALKAAQAAQTQSPDDSGMSSPAASPDRGLSKTVRLNPGDSLAAFCRDCVPGQTVIRYRYNQTTPESGIFDYFDEAGGIIGLKSGRRVGLEWDDQIEKVLS